MLCSWLTVLFLLSFVGGKYVRHRRMHIELDTSIANGSFHPENTLKLRERLHGETCTICLEEMDKERADELVVCAHSRGGHGFHLGCLKENIVERHTKCLLCGNGVQLPISNSVLRQIYQNHLKELQDTIQQYSYYPFDDAVALIDEPFQSNMRLLAGKMTFPFGQKSYLERHFPNELQSLCKAYDDMLSNFSTKYKIAYIENTHYFVEKWAEEYNEQHLSALQFQAKLEEYVAESFKFHARIQQLWWHNLDVVSMSAISLDVYTLLFHIDIPSKEPGQKLRQWCDSPDNTITNALLKDFTSFYQSEQQIFILIQANCTMWHNFIPTDFRALLYPVSAYGRNCIEAEKKQQELHEFLPIFVDKVVQKFILTFNFSTKRSVLNKKVVTEFLETFPRHKFSALATIYNTFHDFQRLIQERQVKNEAIELRRSTRIRQSPKRSYEMT